MLAYFVHAYVTSNTLTPDFILVLFITSVLAAAWALATVISYARARHSAMFVALVDLGFVGAFIAGVYELRGIANQNKWALNFNKNCAMLKASFAFGIMNCIFFFFTFVSLTPNSILNSG
jgi:hypothetical protein